MYKRQVLENKPDADIMAFEKDLMTGKILRHLHSDQKVRIQGYEKIEKDVYKRQASVSV